MYKPTKRKAFNFLRSYFDVVNELQNDKDKVDFLMAVINKQFLDEDPKDLSFVVNLCYASQKHAIESSVKGYLRTINTDLQGNPQIDPKTHPVTIPPTLPPTIPKEEKEKEKEKEEVKVKVKEDINGRKLKFSSSIQVFLSEYDRNDLLDFYNYWTEHGEKDKKMRFEKETSFDVKKRIERWMSNKQKFKGNGKQQQQTKSNAEIYDDAYNSEIARNFRFGGGNS